MSEIQPQRGTCDICRSEFPRDVLEETTPLVVSSQAASLTVCAACRVIYNFDPDDAGCFACGTPIHRDDECGYRLAVEFPVNDQPDGPLATLSEELCGECSSKIGIDVLFSGVTSRETTHADLIEALNRPYEHDLENENDRTEPDCIGYHAPSVDYSGR